MAARLGFAIAIVILFAGGCGTDASVEGSVNLPAVSAGPPSDATQHAGKQQAEPSTAQELAVPRYRGLWVLCQGSQRVLEDPAKIRALMEDAHALEVTDLFVQVYRGGRAWFRSTQSDDGPYQQMIATGAPDPLASLIEQAHASGLRVHAWVNVLSLSKNREAPIFKELGRDAIHMDRKGRSILDYPTSFELPKSDSAWYRAGTPGLYLDPGAPGVAERLVATFRELVANYPTLDGLHLDYIRHPGVLPFSPGSRFGVGLDYGYGPATRLRFRRETGVNGPFLNDESPDTSRILNSTRWDSWRREKVTELVLKIGTATSEVQPDLRLSAAVISYIDRAYLSLAQDWRRWLEEGTIDFAVPMVYTKDDRLFRYQVEAFAKGPEAKRIWAGVGVWLFDKQPERARKQLEIAGSVELAGDALFSYDSIIDARNASKPEMTAALTAPNLFSAIAEPPADPAKVSEPAKAN